MTRRQDIEALRLLSVFGVVGFHLWGSDVAYAGLVVFLLLSLHFQARASEASRRVGARARRLLVPWLAWCAFYGAFNVARGAPLYPSGDGLLASFLTGTHIHLWYLPFVFLVLCAFDQADRRLDARGIGFASGFIALALLATAALWRAAPPHVPWAQFAHASIGVFAGAFLARFERLPRVAASLLLAALFAACLAALPLQGIGVPYGVGLLVAAPLLLAREDRLPGLRLHGLAECVMGVYLAHLFFDALLPRTISASWAGPPLVFAVSLASIRMFRRIFPRFARAVT